MPPSNQVTLQTHGAATLLEISGDITSYSGPFLNDAYNKACEQNARRILLKIDPNAYINSGGIALLIQILARSTKNRQQIGITGISAHFKKIFQLVGITRFAAIYETIDEALEAMDRC